MGGSGTSDTGARDCGGRDARGGASLPHRLFERLAGLRFADADNVAGAGDGRGQELGIIAYGAGCLGTAAVNAEVVGHGLFLTQCRGQGSGARGQGSGVRGQGPVISDQWSVIGGQSSGCRWRRTISCFTESVTLGSTECTRGKGEFPA